MPQPPPAADDFDPVSARYSRQMLYPQVGVEGQRRLGLSRVALLGCGALGTVLANTLARAGVGYIRIIDRDFIEPNNLQRQVLFDERDIAAGLPKAEAAAQKLRKVNSAIEVEGVVTDLNATNAEALCGDVDLLLDGTDNFETRFLINDVAVKHDLPWVYGACVAAEGLVMPILPRQTPCLRCIWEDAPPPGMTPTCDTAGVLSPIVNIVASLQAMEAIKIMIGDLASLNRKLVSIDVWSGQFRSIDMQSAYEGGDCPCCKHGRYEFLSGQRASATASLCGRNAVQVLPPAGVKVNFRELAARLPSGSRPTHNQYMLKFTIEPHHVTLFADGRAIIQGTSDAAAARSVYARYIGS